MADAAIENLARDEEPEGPVVLRKPAEEEVDMDITPMIDIVFLLLIFFLVCSTAASQMAVELPTARHGTGVSERNSVTITVEASGGDEPATVYIGDTSGKPLPNSIELQEAEIVQAVRRLLADSVAAADVDEELLSAYLYTSGLPDPDLIVRTAGEMRLSNFLIWQGAYAEYYSTSKYWPDFDRDELRRALEAYAARERRFGRLDAPSVPS